MKVAIINHSDVRGGASVVSLRLTEALREIGVEATMVTGRKESGNRYVEQGVQWRRRLSFIAEHVDIMLHNSLSRKNLFKISTGRYGMGLHRHKAVREADVVVLNWVNQGTLSLGEIEKIVSSGKPVVWIMHDRWCQTGVCHHVASGCQGPGGGCGHCPLLRGGGDNDLSARVYEAKRALYGRLGDRLRFVAVSSWLGDQGAGSLTGGCTVIPNAIDVERYSARPVKSRRELDLPERGPLVMMGAARLDDPVKNLPLAVESLNRVGTPVSAVFFGDIRDHSILERLTIPYTWLGGIADSGHVADILSHATVILSTSEFETLPTTIIEGMAAGATAVSTATGGQADIIDHGVNGYLSQRADADEIARYIERAVRNPADRRSQHETVARKFGARQVARRYAALFREMMELKINN